MPKPTLESRIEKLEQQVAQLVANGNIRLQSLQPPTDTWKSANGALKGAGIKEVLDEALQIREQHRKEFYEKQSRRRTTTKRRKVAS